MIHIIDVHNILSLSEGSPAAPSPPEPIILCGMSGADLLSAMESWEGMVDKFTAAEKKPILVKEEQVPDP